MAHTIRNFRWDDLPALLTLIQATPGDSLQDLIQDEVFARKWLEQPGCNPERDYFLSFQGDRVAGYSRVEPESPIERAIISWTAPPSLHGCGLGQQLLSRAMAHARFLKLKYAHAPASSNDTVAHQLLGQQGFAPVRVEWYMRRVDGAVPLPHLPSGYTLRHLQPGEDTSLATLQNVVFGGNWGFCPNTPEQVAYRIRLLGSSLESVLILTHDDEPIGYCWTRVNASTQGQAGIIWMTGVLPQYRGRGLGRIIIVAGLHYLTGLGLSTIDLNVDAANMPARRLYTSLGFQQIHQTQWYEATL